MNLASSIGELVCHVEWRERCGIFMGRRIGGRAGGRTEFAWLKYVSDEARMMKTSASALWARLMTFGSRHK